MGLWVFSRSLKRGVVTHALVKQQPPFCHLPAEWHLPVTLRLQALGSAGRVKNAWQPAPRSTLADSADSGPTRAIRGPKPRPSEAVRPRPTEAVSGQPRPRRSGQQRPRPEGLLSGQPSSTRRASAPDSARGPPIRASEPIDQSTSGTTSWSPRTPSSRTPGTSSSRGSRSPAATPS